MPQPEPIDRREFLRNTTTAAVALTAASPASAPAQEAGPPALYRSPWKVTPDRVWLGPEFWANPLQDWRIHGGRAECQSAAPDRNVHLLTHQLGEKPGTLAMEVTVGRVGGDPLGQGRGSFGFRVGAIGPLKEYRNSLIFGRGLDAGLTWDGRLFISDPAPVTPSIEMNQRRSVRLRLSARADNAEGDAVVTLAAIDPESGRVLGQVEAKEIPASRLVGNLAIVANLPAPGSAPPGATKKAQAQAKAKAKAQTKAQAPPGGRFWFDDWTVSGSKVEAHPDQTFGPILFTHYTLHRGVLKMTAQMAPVGAGEPQTVVLETKKGEAWAKVAEAPIDPAARTATFRVEGWDDTQDVPYRVAYPVRYRDSIPERTQHWEGTIRRDPIDRPTLSVLDVSCNAHYAFPNHEYVAQAAKLDPDLIAFTGDQFYEPSGGYGVQRAPVDAAILDLLRKWYLHGWTWRELTRDRPAISIPDDHDVYQGNIWGEAGGARRTTQEAGGYEMPVEWVNVVHRTQTAHHPDGPDTKPTARGISVYFGPLTYGRVSFAVVADRQFKSAPEGKVPPTGGRGDHVTDPNFDPKTADLPGLELLGERQIAFLRDWADDWHGADMKAVVSQTIFTAMATTHGGNRERLRADYDTNGWPQAARNAALRAIRKAFAFHIAGDQHLPAVVQYGVEDHNDAAVAFAGPAVNNLYPRWWEPDAVNQPPAPGAVLGEFRDSFGHPLTVLAVANPKIKARPGVYETEVDKSSGLGIVRFDRRERTITAECWPFLADPTRPGGQFPGWPVRVRQVECYGRTARAYLPTLKVQGVATPVIRVSDAKTGEVVYTLRAEGPSFRPFVFAPGTYDVAVSDPDATPAKSKVLKGLTAAADNNDSLDVIL